MGGDDEPEGEVKAKDSFRLVGRSEGPRMISRDRATEIAVRFVERDYFKRASRKAPRDVVMHLLTYESKDGLYWVVEFGVLTADGSPLDLHVAVLVDCVTGEPKWRDWM